MQVRAKLAGTSRTLHRCHHFAADHEATDVAALRLAHEFLHQKIGIEPAKCFNHRRCGVRGFGQHHALALCALDQLDHRSEEHTSELQYLMRIPYAVFSLQKKTTNSTLNN